MDLTAPPQAGPLELALRRELLAGERVLWRGGRLPRVVGSHFDSDRQTDHFELGEVADVMAAESCVRQLAEQAGRIPLSS